MATEIGGIRCDEVLARLADILDGELTEAERTRVGAHVAGCPACARFGARYHDVVRALREADVPADVAAALDARLRGIGGRE